MGRVITIDLDETLFNTTTTSLAKYGIKHDFTIYRQYFAHVRPYLNTFLDFVYDHFTTVGVYTTAEEGYAQHAVDNLFGTRPLDFFFSREDCLREAGLYSYGGLSTIGGHGYSLKSLLKIAKLANCATHEIFVVDDKLEVYTDIGDPATWLETGRVLKVIPYDALNNKKKEDIELLNIVEKLKKKLEDTNTQPVKQT